MFHTQIAHIESRHARDKCTNDNVVIDKKLKKEL